MNQAQNGKPSIAQFAPQPPRATKPPTPTALAAAKRIKPPPTKPQCLKNNLAAYTSSQQQAPFLENPKKPFSEIPKIAG